MTPGRGGRTARMNVALFLPNWVGDAVMATPAIRALRRQFPSSRIVGVLRPYIADVFGGSGWFDELIHLDPKGTKTQHWPAVAAQLRRRQIDLAVLFPNSFHSALTAWLGRCRERVGYALHGRALLLTRTPAWECDAQGRRIPSPIVDAYNHLARAAGCAHVDRRMQLFTTPDDETAANKVWSDNGFDASKEFVCLSPGAAFGAAKHWPSSSFAELARHFRDERGSQVLVLCGPKERELARAIVQEAGRPAVASLADGDVSLGLTKACIRRSDLLVTTDSGPRHFATAFDRPVVTLFGPTHIAWTETFHPLGVNLQKQVACGPCQLRRCPVDHRCMTLLTPREVYDASVRLLAKAAPSREASCPI
ncbi:MAG TPA: lipopolysaccharide heptosyltransferase II [Gemmataceae bacterium]|nr:lipopolysaccharide heptosyltransferase II [Gemmataceae bacterium]